jgi:periplasmic protein TonB
MGYSALLFCPDEKTARVLSRILAELEFSVDASPEPFAAVKKITSQHFDAIVVDCENEQNGALLFKSARTSTSNQSALSVAVVEGQTGVAKAFRLGANLVLTKPINIEQCKGTLRVARGLLRKGETAKPVETTAPVATTSIRPSTTPPPSSGAAFDLDPEPDQAPGPAEAALLEYMPSTVPGAAVSPAARAEQFPWQPSSKWGEPMASSLRRAAEIAGKTESLAGPASQKSSSLGAAAAPAPAKELATVTPIQIGKTKTIIDEPEDFGVMEPAAGSASAMPIAAPKFSSLTDTSEKPSGGGKKFVLILLAAALVVGGYFVWKTLNASHASQPQAAAQKVTKSRAALIPAVPDSPANATTSSDETITLGAPEASSNPSSVVEPSAPTTKPSAKPSAAKSSPIAPDTVTKASNLPKASEPLIVKGGAAPSVKSQEQQEAPSLAVTVQADDKALAGIIGSTNAALPKQPQQTLKISQGVSQGLLVKRVTPVYPQQARQMRLEGSVQLLATIGKSGDVTSVKQLSGDGILGRAAADAVRQWKYKPYYLNGEPIEIQTQVTVNFKLP